MSDFRAGVLLTIIGALLIPLGDALAKYANAVYAIDIGFMAWSRFALGALLFAPIALAGGVRIADLMRPPVILRGLLISATVGAILQAASREPLANVYGAFFVAPILSFLLAVVFLRERAGLVRWALMFVGILGVLLVVRPDVGISTGMGFALAAGVLYAGFLVTNRSMSGRHRAFALLWAQLCVGAVVLWPFSGPFDISAATLPTVICIVLSAITSAMANLFLVMAYARVEASRLAPLIYCQLVGATAYGVVFFGVLPDAVALSGLVLLLVSGAAGFVLRLR